MAEAQRAEAKERQLQRDAKMAHELSLVQDAVERPGDTHVNDDDWNLVPVRKMKTGNRKPLQNAGGQQGSRPQQGPRRNVRR